MWLSANHSCVNVKEKYSKSLTTKTISLQFKVEMYECNHMYVVWVRFWHIYICEMEQSEYIIIEKMWYNAI